MKQDFHVYYRVVGMRKRFAEEKKHTLLTEQCQVRRTNGLLPAYSLCCFVPQMLLQQVRFVTRGLPCSCRCGGCHSVIHVVNWLKQ
jgi:hypothetical protein